MAKKKWSAELTINFLEGYESHPCLWDVHNGSYKNKDAREDAYQKLINLMDIEGFGMAEVKAKIRCLRNAYALELAKIKKSQRSGAGVDKLYKPKVPWFSVADRILKEVVQIRDTQTSEIIGTGLQSELDDSLENTQPTSPEILSLKKPTPQKLTSNFTAPKRLRKRASSTDKPIREEDNEFDCFGKLVASSLKKLPESVALESMEYIQSYLVRKRLFSTHQHTQNLLQRPSSASSTYDDIENPTSNRSSYYDDDSRPETPSYHGNNTATNVNVHVKQEAQGEEA